MQRRYSKGLSRTVVVSRIFPTTFARRFVAFCCYGTVSVPRLSLVRTPMADDLIDQIAKRPSCDCARRGHGRAGVALNWLEPSQHGPRGFT